VWVQTGGAHKVFGLSYLNYSLKGSTTSVGHFNLNYITNAYLAGVYLTRKAALFIGPEAGYLLSVISQCGSFRFNGTDEFRRWSLSLVGGARYTLARKWSVAYSYSHGLIGIEKPIVYFSSGYATVDNKNNEKNRVHALSLFYQIH
jgi:hypothetical protein